MTDLTEMSLNTPTIKLHEVLIRLAKGMISAWEDWLKSVKSIG